MSQRLVLHELLEIGIVTNDIDGKGDEDSINAYCISEGFSGEIHYEYSWLEFGIADENGSTGESDSDEILSSAEIEKLLAEANSIDYVVNALDEKGYQIDEIERGSGCFEVEDMSEDCEGECMNEDFGFDPYAGCYTYDC